MSEFEQEYNKRIQDLEKAIMQMWKAIREHVTEFDAHKEPIRIKKAEEE